MSNLTVAVLAPPDYSKDLGKKGTASDITFYNLKKGDATVIRSPYQTAWSLS